MRIDWRELLGEAIREADHTQVEAAEEMSGYGDQPISKNTVAAWLHHSVRSPSVKMWDGIEGYIRAHTDVGDFDMREALHG